MTEPANAEPAEDGARETEPWGAVPEGLLLLFAGFVERVHGFTGLSGTHWHWCATCKPTVEQYREKLTVWANSQHAATLAALAQQAEGDLEEMLERFLEPESSDLAKVMSVPGAENLHNLVIKAQARGLVAAEIKAHVAAQAARHREAEAEWKEHSEIQERRADSLAKMLTSPAVCAICGKSATCFGAYDQSLPEMGVEAFACDDCCGHGNEDGHCSPIYLQAEVARLRARVAELERVEAARV